MLDFLRHLYKAVTIAPPGDTIRLEWQTDWASDNYEYKYTLNFMLKQVEINTHMQLVD